MVTIRTTQTDPDGQPISIQHDDNHFHGGENEHGYWFWRKQPKSDTDPEKVLIPWSNIAWIISR